MNLNAAGKFIPSTRDHRFLGVVIGAWDNGVSHESTIQYSIRCPTNAIWTLCGTRWDNPPAVLLHLYNASRITYGLRYLFLSQTQQLGL